MPPAKVEKKRIRYITGRGEIALKVGQPQIKTAERVRDLGEVFTAEREGNARLALLPRNMWRFDNHEQKRFLEPAAGNGNFLVAILSKKLATVTCEYRRGLNSQRTTGWGDFHTLYAVSSIYGIDICPENVDEARERMAEIVAAHYKKVLKRELHSDGEAALARILETNIQQGDALHGVTDITFTEYQRPPGTAFRLTATHAPFERMLPDWRSGLFDDPLPEPWSGTIHDLALLHEGAQ